MAEINSLKMFENVLRHVPRVNGIGGWIIFTPLFCERREAA